VDKIEELWSIKRNEEGKTMKPNKTETKNRR
jgi:hypothetical protein